MKYWYDQRYVCCETCHYFRDSIIDGRKACGEYGMAFSESKGIVDGVCARHKTEARWREDQQRDRIYNKQKRKTK